MLRLRAFLATCCAVGLGLLSWLGLTLCYAVLRCTTTTTLSTGEVNRLLALCSALLTARYYRSGTALAWLDAHTEHCSRKQTPTWQVRPAALATPLPDHKLQRNRFASGSGYSDTVGLSNDDLSWRLSICLSIYPSSLGSRQQRLPAWLTHKVLG